MTFVWWCVVYLRPNYHSDKAFRSCLVYANHRKYINHELFYAISVKGQWVDMSVSGNYWHLVRECTSCLSCTNISMYIIPMSTSVLVWYLFCGKSEYKKHVIWEIYNIDFFSTTMQCWCTNLSDFKWNSNITCEKYLLKVWKYAVLVDNGDIKIWPHAVYRCRLTFSYFFDICFLFSPMIYKSNYWPLYYLSFHYISSANTASCTNYSFSNLRPGTKCLEEHVTSWDSKRGRCGVWLKEDWY